MRAILSAPEAMPPNPKIAAIIAITIKMTVQRNMSVKYWLVFPKIL